MCLLQRRTYERDRMEPCQSCHICSQGSTAGPQLRPACQSPLRQEPRRSSKHYQDASRCVRVPSYRDQDDGTTTSTRSARMQYLQGATLGPGYRATRDCVQTLIVFHPSCLQRRLEEASTCSYCRQTFDDDFEDHINAMLLACINPVSAITLDGDVASKHDEEDAVPKNHWR
jgi:hypothetical protein